MSYIKVDRRVFYILLYIYYIMDAYTFSLVFFEFS